MITAGTPHQADNRGKGVPGNLLLGAQRVAGTLYDQCGTSNGKQRREPGGFWLSRGMKGIAKDNKARSHARLSA